MDAIQQLRVSDFVIFKGESKGRAYEFAKIDNRCPLMNNEAFVKALKDGGAKVIEVGK